MRALHPQTCGKIGINADEHSAQMHHAGLARFQLPFLGLRGGEATPRYVVCRRGQHEDAEVEREELADELRGRRLQMPQQQRLSSAYVF